MSIYSIKSHTYSPSWPARAGSGYRRQHERAARRYWNKKTKEIADATLTSLDSDVALTDYGAPRLH